MAVSESNFDILAVHSLKEPFPVWICDTNCPPVPLRLIPPADHPMWRSPGNGAVYDNDCEQSKRSTRDPGQLSVPLSGLLVWLRSEQMVSHWIQQSKIDGLIDDPTLHGGGLHVTSSGGWLNPHLDYARHPKLSGFERRLNLTLFLNEEWREEWGGAFEVCDAEGTVVERIFPAPGRLIAFETSDVSYHATQPTARNAPDRVSLAVYYLSPARPSATRLRALFMPNRTPR